MSADEPARESLGHSSQAETARRYACGLEDQPGVVVDPKRAAYLSGARRLLDFVEANPAFPLPFDGNSAWAPVFLTKQSRDEFVAFALRLDATDWREYLANGHYYLEGQMDGYRVQLVAPTPQVCDERVTGLRVINGAEVPVISVTTPLAEILAAAKDAADRAEESVRSIKAVTDEQNRRDAAAAGGESE